MGSRSKKSAIKLTRGIGSGETRRRIGEGQVRTAASDARMAPGVKLTNKERLKLSKAGVRNMLGGTMEKNRDKAEKAAKKAQKK